MELVSADQFPLELVLWAVRGIGVSVSLQIIRTIIDKSAYINLPQELGHLSQLVLV